MEVHCPHAVVLKHELVVCRISLVRKLRKRKSWRDAKHQGRDLVHCGLLLVLSPSQLMKAVHCKRGSSTLTRGLDGERQLAERFVTLRCVGSLVSAVSYSPCACSRACFAADS